MVKISLVFVTLWVMVIGLSVSGCGTSGGDSHIVMYQITSPEPDWIRNGEPVELEGELWYPTDNADILLDNEVEPVGNYKGVPLYVQKLDVRPYNRIYTKFAKNKFRVFETKADYDQSKKAF